MSASVLIVEDELLVALDMEATVEDLGYTSVGIASDMQSALDLAREKPDIALVDINLRDGATGGQIGALLSQSGVVVIFVTANPRMLGDGVPGTLGVLSKPCDETCIGGVLSYALSRSRGEAAPAPGAFLPFS